MICLWLLSLFSLVSAQSASNTTAVQVQNAFIDKIFSIYAEDGQVHLEKFSDILHDMNLAVAGEVTAAPGHNHKRQIPVVPEKCFNSTELYQLYGFQDMLTKEQILELAPALVYMSASKQCLVTNAADTANISSPPTSIGLVWLYSLISITLITLTAALGIAFIPVVFKRPVVGDLVMTFFIALSVGILVADAFLHLIPEVLHVEGAPENPMAVWLTTVMVFGVYLFWIFEKFLHAKLHPHHHHHDEEPRKDIHSVPESFGLIGDLKRAKPVAILIILGDAFHNFVDGLTIGASFATDFKLGLTTSLAIFLHEIPHELGDYSVLLASGLSKYRAAIFNMLSNLSAYIGMIIGILLIENSSSADEAKKWILAFGAGAFLYIALVDLMPEMGLVHVMDEKNRPLVKHHSWQKMVSQHFGLLLGWVIMLLIALYGENMVL